MYPSGEPGNACGVGFSDDAAVAASQCDCIDGDRDGVFPDPQVIVWFFRVCANGPR